MPGTQRQAKTKEKEMFSEILKEWNEK